MATELKKGVYYSVPDAAKEIGISTKQLRKQMNQGKVEVIEITSGVHLITRKQVATLKRTEQATKRGSRNINSLKDETAKRKISINLTKAMANASMSQADLARVTGESNARISYYRRGLKLPSIAVSARIADALGMNIGDLLK